MAYLRVEKKKSGNYLRIVETFRQDGKVKQKTLHSLGKVEDYPPEQLENIAKKLLELAGLKMEDIIGKSFQEVNRLNYGYAMVIKRLWKLYKLDKLVSRISRKSKVKFDWMNILQIMLAERINDPCSKRQNYQHANEYMGFKQEINLQHFYRTLDLLAQHSAIIKEHMFTTQQSLFSQQLDVVFYDVTTLYFESQKEQDGNLRQKGYSKDGKAHKIQVVLGLLIDKLRNPITYEIYEGNTYEGHTIIDATERLKTKYNIDQCVVVADSSMINKKNREQLDNLGIKYIIGERLKSLPEEMKEKLICLPNHQQISPEIPKDRFSYIQMDYQDRRIICTYSEKRAKKDSRNREKLLEKAQQWIKTPGKYKQVAKRGAGRFITTNKEGSPIELNTEQILQDKKYDGFKAIATTTDLLVEEILDKYKDLFEVEHSFRTLKSQIELRPVYHWTNARIKGHIAMCFMAYTMLNYLRNITGLQCRQIVKALDKMQMSQIKEGNNQQYVYMRSSVDKNQKHIFDSFNLVVPNNILSQNAVNLMFRQ